VYVFMLPFDLIHIHAYPFIHNSGTHTKIKHLFWPFAKAFDYIKFQRPDYPNIVKKPMDFSKIRTKINSKEYPNPKVFELEMRLIFSNAMLYNKIDKDKVGSVYQLAEELELHFERHWALGTSVMILYAYENLTKSQWKKEEQARAQEEFEKIKKAEYDRLMEEEHERNEGFVERERLRRQKYDLEMQRKARAECPMLSQSELKEEEEKIHAYRKEVQAKVKKLRIETENRAVMALVRQLRGEVGEEKMEMSEEEENVEMMSNKSSSKVEFDGKFQAFTLSHTKKKTGLVKTCTVFSGNEEKEKNLSKEETKMLKDWNNKVKRVFQNNGNGVSSENEEKKKIQKERNKLFRVFLLLSENTISVQEMNPTLSSSSSSSFKIVSRGQVILNRSEELDIDVVRTVKSRFVDLGISSSSLSSSKKMKKKNTLCLEIICEGSTGCQDCELSSLKSRLRKSMSDESLFSLSHGHVEMSESMKSIGNELENTAWFGESGSDAGVYVGVYSNNEDGLYVKIFGMDGMVSINAHKI